MEEIEKNVWVGVIYYYFIYGRSTSSPRARPSTFYQKNKNYVKKWLLISAWGLISSYSVSYGELRWFIKRICPIIMYSRLLAFYTSKSPDYTELRLNLD